MGLKKKVVLLGDSAVGKTSLIRRYVLDIFEDAYIATIGSKVTRKDLVIERPDKTVDLTLMIWDVLGREGYTGAHARTLAGVHGAILVADLTRRETLDSLERYWIPALSKVTQNVPLVFVGNKSDLVDGIAFKPEHLAALASRHNVGLDDALPSSLRTSVTTSAKSGKNVAAAFEALGHLLASGRSPEDPMKEVFESVVAMGVSRAADKSTPIGALDSIIVDFCECAEGEFEDDRTPMMLLRQEILRAGVDVRAPARDGLLRAVDYLAEAESEYLPPEAVSENRARRLGWALGVRT